MKVILLQDVAKIGRRHSVVEVPDGYARNKLIPMRAAVPATPEALAKHKAQMNQAAAQRAADVAALRAACARLANEALVVAAPANAQGHLFKQITAKDIAAAAAAAGSPVPVTAIVLTTPIKELGEHTVTVRAGELDASFVLMVQAVSV